MCNKNEKSFMRLFYCGLSLCVIGQIGNYVATHAIFSFLNGAGVSLTLIGVFFILIARKHPNWTKENEILQKDERMIQIRHHAAMSTFYATLIALTIAEISFVFMNDKLGAGIIIVVMFMHLTAYTFSLHHYDKKY